MTASLSLQPAQFDLSIYKGDSVSVDFVLKNADGTAYTVPAVNSGTGWSANIEKADGTSAGTFTLSITDNTLTAYATPTVTAALDPAITYVYDIQYNWKVGSGGSAVVYNKTFIRGNITVTGDVT